MYQTALVMIARDEARCIADSLRSLRPWVDRMIVLDTGSLDGTPEIARAEGAEVHAFAWVDDFAAARNAALALSDADWNLVVDADEVLILGGEALAALRHEAPTFVGRIEVCSPLPGARRAGWHRGAQRLQPSGPRVAPWRALHRAHPRTTRLGPAPSGPAGDARPRRLPAGADGGQG